MKFRFALLVAALALALSISAFAYSEEPAQDTAAPAQEETTTDGSAPFVLLRVYEGQFADVKDGDWFAPSVVSAYEYAVCRARRSPRPTSAGGIRRERGCAGRSAPHGEAGPWRTQPA